MQIEGLPKLDDNTPQHEEKDSHVNPDHVAGGADAGHDGTVGCTIGDNNGTIRDAKDGTIDATNLMLSPAKSLARIESFMSTATSDVGSDHDRRSDPGDCMLNVREEDKSITKTALVSAASPAQSPSKGGRKKKEEREEDYHILKKPSVGLLKYQQALIGEYEARPLLEGKKHNCIGSKFKLPPASVSPTEDVPGQVRDVMSSTGVHLYTIGVMSLMCALC